MNLSDRELSWVSLLQARAAESADLPAYTFLHEDEQTPPSTLTFGQLDRRARAIAAHLQALPSRPAPGERVLILHPSGIDYITGFFGCLYARLVAVPVYPPETGRAHRVMPRLESIAQDAGATIAMTTTSVLLEHEAPLRQLSSSKTELIATDAISDRLADDWHTPDLSSDEDVALIQYTSGSTSTPRGVVLSHANMLANASIGCRAWRLHPQSVGISWLPLYHDLGVLTVLLQPIAVGFHSVLLSTSAFVQRPVRFLRAISAHRGTFAGGPNFAYELCIRRTTPEEHSQLDLSSWECAFNGAEPVRAHTIDRFVETFASCGFQRESMYPCYGLAEANFVSGGLGREAPRVRYFTTKGLESRRVIEADAETATDAETTTVRALVGCGRLQPGQSLAIVDERNGRECNESKVGEIWISGASVGRGYYRRPEESERLFGAQLEGRKEMFLRTGDLGFIHRGELFIAGRVKDLIIIRGANFYPQDIEETVERSHPLLRPGCAAAFSVEVDDEERLVVVEEIKHDGPEGPSRPEPGPQQLLGQAKQAAAAIRSAIIQHHELQPYAIVLVRSGTSSKTSSGKIQRALCKSLFLSGSLQTIFSWSAIKN